ncbi:hypothetical protein QR680_012007 [Steinernema hermaphroditum]|uniref:Uncharacterized protein n=1 Tax=Steinernema hermaphroditum TaxID=289476 RepID=A0AA39LZ34_9BILA|nr:hypothetical protein QR680_012007 [Steinernema hermaphroditum]
MNVYLRGRKIIPKRYATVQPRTVHFHNGNIWNTKQKTANVTHEKLNEKGPIDNLALDPQVHIWSHGVANEWKHDKKTVRTTQLGEIESNKI